MRFLMNMKLIYKFLLITALTCAGFAVIGYVFNLQEVDRSAAIQAHEKERRLSTLVGEIETDLLRVQSDKQEFLLSKSKEYVEYFDQSLSQMLQNIESVILMLEDPGEKAAVDKLRTTIKDFGADFQKLVTAMETRGLDHNSGLHGELRRSAKEAEATLQKFDETELTNSMLLMRRHEKVYMARKLDKYLTKMAAERQRFTKLLQASNLPAEEKADVQAKLGSYFTNLFKLAPIDKQIAEAASVVDDVVSQVKVALVALLASSEQRLQASKAKTEAHLATAKKQFYVVLAGTGLIAFVLLMLVALVIRRSVLSARNLANAIASGNLDNVIEARSTDELGQLMASLQTMQTNLRDRTEAEAKALAENGRIRQALDNVSGSAMIADPELNIIYMNTAIIDLFQQASNDIRGELPGFDVTKLMGSNIDLLYKNSTQQSSALVDITTTHNNEFVLGGRTLRVIANPVLGSNSERLGTVLEWKDRSDEVATVNGVQRDVQQVVESALRGDLSKRIAMDDKEGFFHNLSQGVNQLVGVAERVIEDTVRVLSAMASGNLTEKIAGDYDGSFGKLKQDVNGTVAKLTEVVEKIQIASASVKVGSDEISQGNVNLSQRTEEQAASLVQSASSMQEMTSTVRQNADNAAQANQLAQAAREGAEKGGAVVSQAVDAMQEINASSKQISDIIGVIDEIAFQTNLLALNASVEAARAGDQGRGFAVVASEVRNLAGRSATAAKEIKDLIEDSGRKVNDGSRLVNESGETLQEIVSGVKKVTDIVGEIAAASREQATGVDEVNKAIGQMDEMTQQNAALVEQAAAASESLAEQAEGLSQVMAFFTLNGNTVGSTSSYVGAERRASQRPWSNKAKTSQAPKPIVRQSAASGGDQEWEEF